MSRVLGIDFGTSYSSCALMIDRHPVMVPSRFGSPHVPSVIGCTEEGRFLLGEPARKQWLLNYQNTVYGFKRFMGHKYSSRTVQSCKDYFFYEMAPGPQDTVHFLLRQRAMTAEEIGALLLVELRTMAQNHLHAEEPIREAIVSVPAYFSHAQRQSIRASCAQAGLYVRKIINEPTAAALAYGYDRGLRETVLIYDLGGGTFDVTVMEIDDTQYRVLATTGDTLLGGLDFDNRIVEHWADLFQSRHGVDLFTDMAAIQRLRDAAERTKIELSGNASTRIRIPGLYSDPDGGAALDFDATLSVEALNEISLNLVDRTLRTCAKALKMAGKAASEIDQVLLVGGQTWMPLIRRKIEAFFGKPPTKRIHPMEAVTRGCCIQASIFQSGLAGIEELYLLDVLPQSIGFRQKGRMDYVPVFQSNCRTNSRTLMPLTTTQDGQTSILLEIRQGDEANPEENELLGFYEFDGIPPRPRGKAGIEMEFFVDKQCLLTVIGKDPESGREFEAQF